MKIFCSLLFISALSITSCAQPTNTKTKTADKAYEIVKTEAEWRAQLSPEAFDVLRENGTERAFTGDYNSNKKDGVYHCAGCMLPLFDSDTKFDSGTGWPSFYDYLGGNNVRNIQDTSYGMVRTEVVCNRCGGHLGHVFEDGPKPTGLRYCINSVSLNFVPSK